MTVDQQAVPPTDIAAQALREAGGLEALWRAGVDTPGHPLLARGAIIAVADLVDCHTSRDSREPYCDEAAGMCSPWAIPGMAHWQLAGVRPLEQPLVHRGNLGLCNLPPRTRFEVLDRIAASPAALLPIPVLSSAAGPGST